MNAWGIPFTWEYAPALDPGFLPFAAWRQAYLQKAHHPVAIAIERNDGKRHTFRSFLRDESFSEANCFYMERLVKLLLWSFGGYRITICGCDAITEQLRQTYSPRGARAFDAGFVQDVFDRPLEILPCTPEVFPGENESGFAIGGHMEGCRIGFDAGGSDRKVSAVVDGKTVYSEEVVWYPKEQTDPQYHYDGILSAFRTAAAQMPRVDAIGVSSAGVYVDNQPRVASLFLKVPREKWDKVRSVYLRAAAEIGNVPLVVANDGDVTALSGAMSMNTAPVLGLAMGTSEAAGYIDADGHIMGWLNELAFAPVDLNKSSPTDLWSGDRGVGGQYFSQDAVSRLAAMVEIPLNDKLSPAEKLSYVQELADNGDARALLVFQTIGAYLAHTLPLYDILYAPKTVLLLGRVASGIGGEQIVSSCRAVLNKAYPELARRMQIVLPNEQMRRVGQSVAAASLPELRPVL